MFSPLKRGNRRQGLRLAQEPHVLAQGAVELETVAALRHQGSLDDFGGSGGYVLDAQADAIADAKTARIREGDLLIVPVGILREPGGERRLFKYDGIRTAAEDTDVALQVDRVAKTVGARQYPHRAASPARDRIDRGLNHLFVRSHEVRVLGTDGESQPLVPRRFDGVARGGTRFGDGEVIRSRRRDSFRGRRRRRSRSRAAQHGGLHEISAIHALPSNDR